MSDSISQLTELLRELPGIGPRQARRLAFYLVRRDAGWVTRFANTVLEARKATATCTSCMRLYPIVPGSSRCQLCASQARDRHTLMLVEKDVDLENVERTGTYRGLYFVLGGTTSPLDRTPEKSVRLHELEKRIEDPTLEEVIFACSATTEGEDTVLFIRERLTQTESVKGRTLRFTVLGRGLSTGTELEYVDTDTMQNALRGRS